MTDTECLKAIKTVQQFFYGSYSTGDDSCYLIIQIEPEKFMDVARFLQSFTNQQHKELLFIYREGEGQ